MLLVGCSARAVWWRVQLRCSGPAATRLGKGLSVCSSSHTLHPSLRLPNPAVLSPCLSVDGAAGQRSCKQESICELHGHIAIYFFYFVSAADFERVFECVHRPLQNVIATALGLPPNQNPDTCISSRRAPSLPSNRYTNSAVVTCGCITGVSIARGQVLGFCTPQSLAKVTGHSFLGMCDSASR